MLSKDVCKQCWEDSKNRGKSNGWHPSDEANWDRGFAYCCGVRGYADEHLEELSIESSPPKGCIHFFEHAVAEGIVNIDKKE